MEYLHKHVVKSDCDGVTERIERWTAGDCSWEKRRCLKCDQVLATPLKENLVPHWWAYQCASDEDIDLITDDEQPLSDAEENEMFVDDYTEETDG